jgi:hypothetical protein
MLKSLYLIWSGVRCSLSQEVLDDLFANWEIQGAPMSAETQNSALRMFASTARICQVYGMTEGGWFTTFHHPESDSTGSVGRLIGSYEAK